MKKVLIVFTDGYLPYSNTTLNIYYILKENGYSPQIIAPAPTKHFSSMKSDTENIKYISWKGEKEVTVYKKIVQKVKAKLNSKNILFTGKAKAFVRKIKQSDADIYIAIDSFALWCLQVAHKKAHLVSLELHENDSYYPNINYEAIESVIIQSPERFEYLFKNKTQPPMYLVQNAPPFLDFEPDLKKRDKKDLIFCGTAWIDFGLISCLEFLQDFPEYTMTIIGAIPPEAETSIQQFHQDLIDTGRLKIDKNYYDIQALTRIVSTYRIGLVFYDFYRQIKLRKFNTYSAPSGKLYQYFNSGVPVIGNYLQGFSIVESQNAGVLIPYISSVQIKKAIDIIETDYENFARNAKHISKTMDAKVAIEKFIAMQLNHQNSN